MDSFSKCIELMAGSRPLLGVRTNSTLQPLQFLCFYATNPRESRPDRPRKSWRRATCPASVHIPVRFLVTLIKTCPNTAWRGMVSLLCNTLYVNGLRLFSRWLSGNGMAIAMANDAIDELWRTGPQEGFVIAFQCRVGPRHPCVTRLMCVCDKGGCDFAGLGVHAPWTEGRAKMSGQSSKRPAEQFRRARESCSGEQARRNVRGCGTESDGRAFLVRLPGSAWG